MAYGANASDLVRDAAGLGHDAESLGRGAAEPRKR